MSVSANSENAACFFLDNASPRKRPKRSISYVIACIGDHSYNVGMLRVTFLIKGTATLILGAAVYFFVLPIFSGAPYAPTKNRRVEEMLGPLGQGRGKRAADLGSGDGRIVIALAQR